MTGTAHLTPWRLPFRGYNSVWQVRETVSIGRGRDKCRGVWRTAYSRRVMRPAEAEPVAILTPWSLIGRFRAFPGRGCTACTARVASAHTSSDYRAVEDRSIQRSSWHRTTWSAPGAMLRRRARRARRGSPPIPGSPEPSTPTAAAHFEVLVVESMTEAQESALRKEVRSWRRPDDEFVYELVVVPSGDEALIAARLNVNLQAVVIRRRFNHRSPRPVDAAEFVDTHISDELADHSHPTTGPGSCGVASELRPGTRPVL